MSCPACGKRIGNFHRTPNGFHRDCFIHWEKGYIIAMKVADKELKLAGLPLVMELYTKRCTHQE